MDHLPPGPASADELVQAVSEFFTQMGCAVQLNAPLRSEEGPHEIDVLVSSGEDEWAQTILVDCSHWERHVDQHLAFTYRSVLAAAGAQRAIILSRYGFHSGVYGALGRSPVEVCTWPEFIRRNYDAWFQAQQADLKLYSDVLVEFRRWPTGDRASSTQLSEEDRASARFVVDRFEPGLALVCSGLPQQLYQRPCTITVPSDAPDEPGELIVFSDMAQWHAFWKPRLVGWVEEVCRWREDFADRASDWLEPDIEFDVWN